MRGGLGATKHLFSPRKHPYSINLKPKEYELYRKFIRGNAERIVLSD